MFRFGIRSVLLLALAGNVWAAPSSTDELSSAETAALLKKLAEHRAKFPSLTADFTEEKTTRLLNKPLLSQGTLAFQTPNSFRREIKGANPSVMISNGQKLWIYYPNFKQAELYQLGQRAFFDESIAALTAGLNFQDVTEHYTVRAYREEPGYRLVLTPKSGGLRRMLRELTVWIGEEFRMNKTVATLAKGDRIVTTYRNPKPRPLPASTFEFTPPPDAQVTQPLGR
jgi:outer membrane lipoprotein carrier protein